MGPVYHVEQLLFPALMAISFAACSVGTERLQSLPVPANLETDPGHFVVVTVRNETTCFPLLLSRCGPETQSIAQVRAKMGTIHTRGSSD